MIFSPSRHISISQARNAVLVAIGLSLVMSAFTFRIDLLREGRRIDLVTDRMINTAYGPLSQAAYVIDADLAKSTLDGLLEYPQVLRASLTDDFDGLLGMVEIAPRNTLPLFLVERLTVWTPEKTVQLYGPDGQLPVGKFQVALDNEFLVKSFLDRAVLNSALAILRDLVLAVILTLIFFTTLTKPLLRVSGALQRISPAEPGKTPVPTPKGHERDEIGQLVAAMNSFLADLGASLESRRIAEKELVQAEEKYRSIFENAVEGMFQSEPSGRIISCNPAMARILGYDTPEEIMAIEDFPSHAFVGPSDKENIIQFLSSHGTLSGLETQFYTRNRNIHWGALSVRGIFDNQGGLVRIDGILEDITDRKKAKQELEASNRELTEANERIRKSLEEKEVLLREIHHRVKNNLQVISSLLQLQAGTEEDRNVATALAESRDRIKSMALIHEGLYRSGDFSHIEFPDYAKRLATGLVHSLSGGKRIELALNMEPITLPVDTAIPCGLIVNELLTNCLKHAFREADSGTISLSFTKSDDVLRLEAVDSGPGFPPGFDPARSDSLGMQLISGLTDQIHGTLERENIPGACIRISFPAPAKQGRTPFVFTFSAASDSTPVTDGSFRFLRLE